MSEVDQNKSQVPLYQVVWSNGNTAKVIPVSGEVETTASNSKRYHAEEISNNLTELKVAKPIEITSSQSNLYQLKLIEHEVNEEISTHEKSNHSDKIVVKQEEDQDTRNKSKIKSDGSRKKFINSWYNLPAFSNWLQESPIPGFAFCQVCRKDLQPGKSELLKHASTAKHKRKMDALGHGNPAKLLRQHIIDLRSDSVTKPCGLMKEAMINADIRNNSVEADPSVNELEVKSSILLGKEAALFVPSNNLANLIAVRTHCWTIDAIVIIGDKSTMNSGSLRMLDILGVASKTVRNLEDGTLDLLELSTLLEECTANGPTIILVCIENSHERTGGLPIGHKWMKEMNSICSKYGAIVHIDGTRLVNASVALDEQLGMICEDSTSVMLEYSKGIGAPGGCVLAGTTDFINRARLNHKSYGGVIRSAGLLAAACMVGLNINIKKIAVDHSNAIGIAKGICSANSSAVTVEVQNTRTNVVLLKCDNVRITPKKLCERLMNVTREEALEFNESIFIKAEHFPPDKVKLILHLDITADDVKSAVSKLNFVIKEIDQSSVADSVSHLFS